jgi:hypothetical protein
VIQASDVDEAEPGSDELPRRTSVRRHHAHLRLERKATVVDDATLRHPMGFAKLEQGPLEENKAPELEACASQNAANEFRAHCYSLHAPASEFVASPIVDPMAGQGHTSK